MTSSRLPFCFFAMSMLIVIAMLFLAWHKGVTFALPKEESYRPRRLSIAELTGQIPHNSQDNRIDAFPKDVTIPDPDKPLINPQVSQEVKQENEKKEDKIEHTRAKANVRVEDSTKDGEVVNNVKVVPNGKPQPKIPSDGGPRIFCMIYTTMSSWRTRGEAVRDTWAQRCHVYRFFYTYHDDQGRRLPAQDAVPLPVPDGRDHLTAKTLTGLQWAYTHYADQVDWFFKSDDDTFIVMENLRFVAAQFDPSKAHYIGGRSMDLVEHGYNGGGAGYLLSHETARLMLEEGPKYPKKCKSDGSIEDLDIGICLETFHVYPIDTRDSQQRLTFHPDHPYKIWAGEGDAWRVYTYTLNNKTYGNPQGIRTMSPHTVSFHYVKPAFMYMYDFMLYHLVRHHFNEGDGYKSSLSETNTKR